MEGRAIARFAAAAGRELELDTLVDAWERARSSSTPAFARVHGPPGIGKSHLLRALARRLGGSGAIVVEASADRARGAALGLVAQLAHGLLDIASERVGPSELAAISSRIGPILDGPAHGEESALPPARPLPAGPDASGAEGAIDKCRRLEDLRLDIADALAELLRIALPTTPVFLLDDLDAADGASVELLQYVGALLLQPGNRHGCLAVISYREGRLPAALAGLLDRLPGPLLPLAPLDAEGVRSFLTRPDVVERLFDMTSGDPARLEAVLARSPANLGSRRLARLEPEAQQLLLAAAVLAHGANAALLRRIAPIADAQRWLERLVGEGFLRVQIEASGPIYAFVREADREGVIAAAGPARLARCHVAAGDAWVAAGASVETIARHYLAGDPGGRGAVWAARAAEELAARCAFDTAIEFFHAALAGQGIDRRRLHLGLAAAYEASGDLLAALRHLGLARRDASPAERRRARSEAARLCIRIGKLAQAERLCRIVLDGRTAFDPEDPAAARAWADYAEIRFLRSDYDGAAAAAQEGINRAEGMPALRLALCNTLGKTLLTRGHTDEAAAAFRRNAEEADAAGLLRERMLARINEGVAWHRRGDRESAIRLYREGLALGNDRALGALALGNLAVLYHEVGAFELALDHYGNALAAFTLVRRREGIAHQGINRARLLLFLGDLPAARAGLEHARLEAEGLGNLNLVAQADLVRAEIALQEGDAAGAFCDLERAHATFERLRNPRYLAETEIALVRARLAAGDADAAAGALPALEEKVAALASVDLGVQLALLAAETALANGAAEPAIPRLEAARDELLARPKGVGGETDLEASWQIYDLLARCHDAGGRGDVAVAHRVRAQALLEELSGRVPARLRGCFRQTPQRARLLAGTEAEITPSRATAVRGITAGMAARAIIVGDTPVLARILRRVEPLGRSLAPVLVRGESGVGKELIAASLHAVSPRAALPLVKVVCSAEQEDLYVELFGQEGRDARERRGRFELAQGGAVFLDEVGELSAHAQVALLRLLEQKVILRMGGSEPIAVDVRVICGSSRDLESLLAAGRFREDLYYKLKGAVLELPPLRDRKADIPALASHFLERAREERGSGPSRFSPEALALLASWDWPGNVRELQNLVSAVAIFAEGEVVGMDAFELHGDFVATVRGTEVQVAAAPPIETPAGSVDFYALAQARGIGVRELRHELEVQMISRALLEAKGNISEAARLLQMKRSRLSQIVNGEPELLALARGAGETDDGGSCMIDRVAGGSR